MMHFWLMVLACVVGGVIAEALSLVFFTWAANLEGDDDEG